MRLFLFVLSLSILLCSTSNASSQAFAEGEFNNYKPSLEMGKRLFNAAACGSCHNTQGEIYNASEPSLGGGIEIENQTYGKINAPNISGHSKNGIGDWSRARFLNAMLLGVSSQGGEYVPIHPYEFYAGMKPEHAVDIFEYIKSKLPKVNRPNRPNKLFTGRRLKTNPLFYTFDPDAIRKTRSKEGLGENPADSTSWGKYLVEHVSACGACHTERNTWSYTLKPGGQFQSAHSALGTVEPIELDIPKGTSIAKVLPSRNAFEHTFIGQALRIDGSPMKGSMKRVVESLNLTASDDKAAILQYLKNLPNPEPYEVKSSCEAPAVAVVSTISNGDNLTGSVDAWLQRQCKSCHIRGASAANAALLARAERIATDTALVAPGRPEQSLLFQSISGSGGAAQMPPGQKVSNADIELVKQWILSLKANPNAVAPIDTTLERHSSRNHVGNEEVTLAVQKHIQGLDADDQENVRYFSFQSYFNGHLPCQAEAAFAKQHLTPHLAALNKLLNSLSWERDLIKVKPIAGAPYVYAVDITDLGWNRDQWETLVNGQIPGLDTQDPYPYGANPNGPNAIPALLEIAGLAKTDTPIMRADWFVSHAGDPFRYKFLLRLPDNVTQLERMLGVDLNKEILDANDVVRLGFLEGSSGVSVNNRLLDRIDLPNSGYYWHSYDFDKPVKSRSRRKLKDFPLGPSAALPNVETFDHDGGEMLFSLPNGLQGYYLTDRKGDYLEKGPVSVVFHPVAAGYLSPVFGPEIANGSGCMTCHLNGIIQATDQIKEAVTKEGLLPNSLEERDIFRKLYATDEIVKLKMSNDIIHYLSAIAKIDGNPGLRGPELKGSGIFHEEPVTNFMSVYFEPVNKEKLAAELGFTFDRLKTLVKSMPNTDPAKYLLNGWLIALETRGVVLRSEIERDFQAVYASLHENEPRVYSSTKAVNKPSTIELNSGAAYSTRHGLRIAPLKSEILVCEKAQISVETDQTCLLQVVFPDKSSGKLVFHELPEEMLGGKILKSGERRIIPQECDNCPQLVANEPSPGWEVYVNCFANGAPPKNLTKKLEEAASKTKYQSAHIQFSRATEKVAEQAKIAAPISATARFTTLENPLAKFDDKGLCLKVD